MAATVELTLNQGDKVFLAANCIGSGAIEATDALVTDVVKYPFGSRYYDKTNRVLYIRAAQAGVIGDWHKTAALTVHS